MHKWGKRLPDVIALSVLFIYLSPYIIFPAHAHLMIHDNLDSVVGWYKMIAESGLTFSPNNAVFPNLFNGIPRGCMPSELDFYTLLNLLFSPVVAYCLLIVLQRLVAYFGMKYLLKDYLFKGEYPYHTALISLAFALLPYWPLGEFCVAGQPFVIWALLNILHGKKTIYNWVIIFLFPFCSSDFVFSNLFFLPGILLGMILFFVVSKKWNLYALLAWGLLFILSAVSEYRMFLLQFSHSFTSQRTTFFTGDMLNWKGYAKMDLFLFLKGQYHFYSCQFPIILITLLLSILLIRSKKYYRILAIPLIITIVFSSIDTFHLWSGSPYFFKKLGSLGSLQMRFVTLLPVMWYMIFAISIYFLLKHTAKSFAISMVLIGSQIICLFFNLNISDYQGSAYNENAFYYTYINNHDLAHKSFNTYFAPKMFSEAKDRINYSGETVLCLGFPAELAQYSNFHTASAYLGNYPAEKKQQLVDIFRPELNKIKDSTKLNEIIGARRFQYYYAKVDDTAKKPVNIMLDSIALKKMDIKYLLSKDKIEDCVLLHLKPIGSFPNENRVSPEHLYVYRVQ
jgi:hypothetical protein